MDAFDAALRIEGALLSITDKGLEQDMKSARIYVREIIQKFCGLNPDGKESLSTTIYSASKSGKSESLKSTSIFVLRLLSVPGFLVKSSEENNLNRNIISLVEDRIEPVYKKFNIDRKHQTHDKIEKLHEVHFYCCEKLEHLKTCHSTIQAIVDTKEDILKAVNDSTVSFYLHPYGFSKIQKSIKVMLAQVVTLSTSSDIEFQQHHKEISDQLIEEETNCNTSTTFITKNYYMPFIKTIKLAVKNIYEQSKDMFLCEIKSRSNSVIVLDKKHPLHIKGAEIKLSIPLVNTGPGTAMQVVFEVDPSTSSVHVLANRIELGPVKPGDFVVTVLLSIQEPVQTLSLNGIISWYVVADSNELMDDVNVIINAQRTDVDWDLLDREPNPYAVRIAKGKNFYGRKDKINTLYSSVTRGDMCSSYITGQKRVGKSSLAKVIEDSVCETDGSYYVLNIGNHSAIFLKKVDKFF